jgi:hypothetical protein
MRSSLWSADFYTIGVPSVELLLVRPREAHCIPGICRLSRVSGSWTQLSVWADHLIVHGPTQSSALAASIAGISGSCPRGPPHPLSWNMHGCASDPHSATIHLAMVLFFRALACLCCSLHAAVTASTQTHKLVLALKFTYS